MIIILDLAFFPKSHFRHLKMSRPESIPRLHQTLLSSFSTTIPMPSGGSREIDVPFPKGFKRYAIAFMCFLISVLVISVRKCLWFPHFLRPYLLTLCIMYTGANMGVIISSFIESKADRGQILSAIYYGALSTQLLGGVLSTKFGAKRVLLAGVMFWVISVSTMT
jgi:hypothetical protein